MKQSLFYLLLPLLLFSCSNDDDHDSLMDGRVAVQFGSQLGEVKTRTTADGDQWQAGDQVGIFMFTNGQSLSASNIVEGADNISYQAQRGNNAISSFTVTNASDQIYYPQDGSKVDFIAYYPYKSPLSNFTYPIDVSDQSDASKIDVLYSNNVRTKDKTSSGVNLQFDHAMSKLSFTLIAGTGLNTSDLAGATIAITNLSTSADLDLADGTLSNLNSGQTLSGNTVTDGLSSSAIVIPQTLSGTKLIVTLADNISKFEWDFTTSGFEKGKNHPYKIRVDKTGILVTVGDITDWNGATSPPEDGFAGYKVGDYYPDPTATSSDGGATWMGTKPKGVVFWVDPADSRHGKIVSLDEEQNMQWGPYNTNTNARSTDKGMANMKTIYDLNNTFSIYPAFAWVHNKNSAAETYSNPNAKGIWYLPAKDELTDLYTAYNSYGKTAFNPKLTAAGGAPLDNDFYWSSSEYNDNNAWAVCFDGGSACGNAKFDALARVRCVFAF